MADQLNLQAYWFAYAGDGSELISLSTDKCNALLPHSGCLSLNQVLYDLCRPFVDPAHVGQADVLGIGIPVALDEKYALAYGKPSQTEA